jgi:hypothetical protein
MKVVTQMCNATRQLEFMDCLDKVHGSLECDQLSAA